MHATLAATPRQRNTEGEKVAIEEGKSAAEVWPDKPAKARQKDTQARWTIQYSNTKARTDGTPQVDIASPDFGYKSQLSINWAHGIIRRQIITDASAHNGARLRESLVQTANTGREVWADTAYRSAENEDWLTDQGMVSRIHRKKPAGRPMPKRTRRANALKSAVRAKVEHVFAQQKARMGLTIRTIGRARARAAITLANSVPNITPWRWLNTRAAPDPVGGGVRLLWRGGGGHLPLHRSGGSMPQAFAWRAIGFDIQPPISAKGSLLMTWRSGDRLTSARLVVSKIAEPSVLGHARRAVEGVRWT